MTSGKDWREAEWREDYTSRWFDATTGFDCKCGKEKQMFLSHQDDAPIRCDYCGRQYRLIARIETLDP